MRKKILAAGLALMMLLAVLPLSARAEHTLASGCRVVIWNETYGMALSAKRSDYYQAGVRVAMENGCLTGFGDAEIWTVSIEGDRVCFENAGSFLSLDEESRQLTLDGTYNGWHLRDLGDGTFRIVSRDFETYLTWYSARGVYGVTAQESAQNVLRIYMLPEENEVPTTVPEESTQMVETTTQPAPEIPLETTLPVTEPPVADTETTQPATEMPTEPTCAPTEPATDPTQPPPETQPPEQSGLDTGAWKLYTGQLHAHTADSDGSGTVEAAFIHASRVAGLDFFAVTDHSDSFDNDTAGTLTEDGSQVSQNWAAGKAAARAVTDEDFVGIYGFEMSWNQGQGHISTFRTPGFLSRDREGYTDYQSGLEAYYEALTQVPASISQFNHPGPLHGDFKDFHFYSKAVDKRITLIEVGSGAGGEYRQFYDAYTRALDQGWHLAPTNNQNNHTGQFGDGDTNRTVVLATQLTEAGIYEALSNYRTYATEDSDLQIYYTLNGAVMGSQLSAAQVGSQANLSVKLYDPTDNLAGRLEVITEGGAVAASGEAAEQVTFSLPATAPYYYIRITQPDGDIAVTAPVWIRQRDDLGIQELTPEDPVTRAGEEQIIRLKLYNNENQDLTVYSVTLTDHNGNVLGAFSDGLVLSALETKEIPFAICLEKDGIYTLTAAVSVRFLGEERVLSRSLELTVLPEAITAEVLIDGIHGGASGFAALETLAGGQQIAVHSETVAFTPEQLASCSLLILPAPQRPFEEEFINAVKDYVNHGGNLLLLGTGGGSEELNRILRAVGSTMVLHPDTAMDPVSNGGQPERLFASRFDPDLGLLRGHTYAHFGGCTLDPGDGRWLVKSAAGDVLLATEGNIFLAGSNFLGDDWLRAPENPWALPYANRTIAENLLGISRTLPKIWKIAEVRAGEAGRLYLVEGLVTAGSANPDARFPNTIYIQDATGGIAAVDYGEHRLELGRRVRILGALEIAAGNPQLRVTQITVFGKETPISPKAVGNSLRHSTQGGQLLQLQGEVISVEYEEDLVSRFVLADASGGEATVWMDPAIRSAHLDAIVREGNTVSAVGFAYLHQGETVLRLRNWEEVKLLSVPLEPTTVPTEPTEETAQPSKGAPLLGMARPGETSGPPAENTQALAIQTETGAWTKGAFLWWALLFLLLAAVMWLLRQKKGK